MDATNGNDGNTGLSESTAWKTIAKVNASKFNPGDQILFKRGGSWSENLTFPSSGSAGNPITVGAYGSGNAPIINRLIITEKIYLNFSVIQTTSVGTNSGLSVGWSHDINFTNTIHDGASKNCFAAYVLGAHNSQTWTYNIVFDGCIFKNAAALKTGVGLTINAYSHDITVKNSEAYGNGDNGFQAYDSQGPPYTASPYNIFFLNNKSHDNGTNGFELGWGVHDSMVIRNHCYGNTTQGVIVSSVATSSQSNNVVAYNWIEPHQYGISIAQNAINTHVYNNTVLMSAAASSYAGIWFQTNVGTGNIAKNNIIYASGLSGHNPLMLIQSALVNSNVTADYNLYFNTVSATGAFGAGTTPNYYSSFSAWKAATSQDEYSIWGDPLFVSLSNLHLHVDSPAKDAGVDVGLTRDYDGTPVPQGPGVDIGAFEYHIIVPLPPKNLQILP